MENDKPDNEPLFKYLRITCDLNDILKTDSISSVAVTNRAFFIGTKWGKIFVLDHEGNNISHHSFPQHLLPINKISTDLKGEYVGTCSDDGKICINCLYSDEKSVILNLEHQIKSIELDPNYSKTRRFIIGDTSLILYEKALLGRLKPTVLCDSEGFVSEIKWNGQFIAWSSSIGVRVYDIINKCSIGLVKWDEPNNMKLSDLRCSLVWNKSTLYIGWADTIRTFTIAKRSLIESSSQLPSYILDPMSAFTTEFWICGLAPTENGHLVILGLPKRDEDEGKAQRPILSVIKLRGDVYEELCNDSLTLREFEQFSMNDYSLEYLSDENRCFVISPKDMISASFYEVDDRVKYLIDRDQYSKALDVIREKGGKFTVVDVAKLYVDYLIANQSYDQAAKICFEIFENDKNLWEEEVYKFVKVRQLRAVGPYLPRSIENKLNPQVYEMVMYEYLKFDKAGFLTLVKEWQPALYNATAVINAVHDHFEKKEKNVMLEALAILYSHEGEFDKAVKMYLKLQHKDVFTLIRSQNLYNVMNSMIVELMNLDSEKSIQLLIESNKNPDQTFESLKSHENHLFAFLTAFERIDSTGKFDWKLIQLCVKYDREKLLPLLKRSRTYQLHDAFEMCKNNLLHPEMIYLLDRMGNSIEALEIIISELKDTKMAIQFCHEHDDIELWEYLIDKSINKSEIVTLLMDSMSSFFINPQILINKIEVDQEIVGLKNALITMLHNYDTQVSIHTGCNNILKTDYFSVYEKLIKQQERGAFISSQSNCALCQRQIISNQISNFILFKCKHLFHETCIPIGYEGSTNDFCSICTSNRSLTWNN